MEKKHLWLAKRVAMILAIVLCATSVWASNSNSLPTAPGSKIKSGIYYVNTNTSIINSTTGECGLKIEEGATVTIVIANGATLEVKGGNGVGTSPGGAGILVPATSTLYIYGTGSLVARGGNGGDGTNGADGTGSREKTSKPFLRSNYTESWSGYGGVGGDGGGGAGAGIGTNGSKGSKGANANGGYYKKYYDGDRSYESYIPLHNPGTSGENVNAAGQVYICNTLSTYIVGGTPGKAGADGKAEESYSTDSGSGLNYDTISFGGGGGAGGGAGGKGASIGTGGTGGNGGASGECGGILHNSGINGNANSYKETYCGKTSKAINGSDGVENTLTSIPFNPLSISSAEDLKAFADWVNSGKTDIRAQLGKDIDYTSYTAPNDLIGKTAGTAFRGYFDGNGYKVKLNLDCRGREYSALFSHISNATIKNLVTTGTINADSKFAGGIVGGVDGTSTMENCLSDVSIVSSVNGDGTHGGLVGLVVSPNTLTMNNCGFVGKIEGKYTDLCGGLVGYSESSVSISNSYVSGQFTQGTIERIFARGYGVTLNERCYYNKDNTYKNAQGTSVTTADVKSGKLCYMLNGDNGDTWRQTLATAEYPSFSGNTVWYSTYHDPQYFNPDSPDQASTSGNYISSRGEAYIDLGETADKGTKITCHVRLNKIESGANAIIGSAASSSASCENGFFLYVDGSDKSFVMATGSTQVKTTSNMAKENQDYYVTIENGKVEVDTVANATSDYFHKDIAVYPFNENPNNLTVGKINGRDESPSDINIYDVAVYHDGTMTKHYVPSFNLKYSLYDLMSDTYLYGSNKEFSGVVATCKNGEHPAYYVTGSGTSAERHCKVCLQAKKLDNTENGGKFICNEGNDYFDTYYTPNVKTEIRVHFATTDNMPEYGFLFGCAANGYYAWNFSVGTNTTASIDTKLFTTNGLNPNTEYFLTMKNGLIQVDLEEGSDHHVINTTALNTSNSAFKAKQSLIIGRRDLTKSNVAANVKIFSVDIYESGKLIHQFVPDSHFNAYCLLDLTDSTYHLTQSASTANFEIFGHDYKETVNSDGVKEKYCNMCGTMDANYIDSKLGGAFILKNNYSASQKIKLHVNLNNSATFSTNTKQTIFGYYTDSSASLLSRSGFKVQVEKDKDSNRFKFIYTNNNTIVTDYIFEFDRDYYITLYKNKLTIDNKPDCNYHVAELTVPYDQTLSVADGEYRVAGYSYASGSDNCAMKIYSFDIYDNDNLTRHYIPTRQNYVPYLYETITGLSYALSKTGTQDASATIAECSTHKYYGDERVESTNLQQKHCRVCSTLTPTNEDYFYLHNGYINLGHTATSQTEIDASFNVADFGQKNYVFDTSSWNLYLNANSNNLMATGENINYTLNRYNDCHLTITPSKVSFFSNQNMLGEKYTQNMSKSTGSNQIILGSSLSSNSNQTGTLFIYSFGIKEGGKTTDYFVPAKKSNDYGCLYNTLTGKYVEPTNNSNVKIQHTDHKYCDIKESNGKYLLCCRTCLGEYEITSDTAYIRTNGISYFNTGYKVTENTVIKGLPKSAYKIVNGILMVGEEADEKVGYADNVNIKEFGIYENGELLHYYIPSRFNGKTGMYDICDHTANAYHQLSVVISTLSVEKDVAAYIPTCKDHKYFTLEKQADGSINKHCYVCNASVPISGLTIQDDADLSILDYGTGNEIYVEYSDKDGKQESIAKKLPTLGSDVVITKIVVLKEGKVLHDYLPAKYNGYMGMYDEVENEYYAVPNSHVTIGDCEHEYCHEERSKGFINNHCFICDKKDIVIGYYKYIKFDANGGTGVMNGQNIDNGATLNLNRFKNGIHFFDGWVRTKGSTDLTGDGSYETATAQDKDTVIFYAHWAEGCTYNNDTVEVDNDTVTANAYAFYSDLRIIDDGYHGFAASTNFTAQSISYHRALTNKELWGTLCLPFAIKSVAGKIQYYDADYVEGNKVFCKPVDAVEAGNPCIYKILDTSLISDDTLHIDGGKNVMIANTAGTTDGTSLSLIGSFGYETFKIGNDDIYAINNNTFWKVNTSVTLRPYRAYITNKTTSAAREYLYIEIENDVDGIASPMADEESQEVEGYYSLNGTRIDKPEKGLYIIRYRNGKTVKRINE